MKTKMILLMLMAVMLVFGCKGGELVVDKQDAGVDTDLQHEIELYERFEKNRVRWREDIANQAKNNPEKLGNASISFWSKKPLDTISQYEKKYDVKVEAVALYEGGTTSAVTFEPGTSTKDGVNQGIERMRKSWTEELESNKRDPSFTPEQRKSYMEVAQGHLDSIDQGEVGIRFIGIEGKWKAIEQLATDEYNDNTIRTIHRTGKTKDGALYSSFAPEYMEKPKGYEKKE